MYALRFKFMEDQDSLVQEAFQEILGDLIAAYKSGFPILRTQVYYPDSRELGNGPPNEFMIEVLNEDGLQALLRFLQSRVDVKQASILVWDAIEAMSPLQSGMWCHSYHSGVLRLSSLANNTSHSYP